MKKNSNSNVLKETSLGLWFVIGLFTCITLIVAGFILPPMGVVDGSVLTAVGEIGIIILIPILVSSKKEFEMDLDDRNIKIKNSKDE